ncbi:MAG: protein phosphatase 2C domain-containing protein [Candidatus Methanomethyliaceae archaeon]
MGFTIRYYFSPKVGNSDKEYEDAFSPKPRKSTIDRDTLAVAIADGATESSFASLWATQLTQQFVRKPFREVIAFQGWLEPLSKNWWECINGYSLPWYAEEKVRYGAFSTFLGLQFFFDRDPSSSQGSWTAIAIGDSCVFQLRDGNLFCSFPISRSSEFGNSPPLLSSNLRANSTIWDKVKTYSGTWEIGDAFLLATDAIAYWFLSEHERGNHPWHSFKHFFQDRKKDKAFRKWIDGLRTSSQMKNDDVTLVYISPVSNAAK